MDRKHVPSHPEDDVKDYGADHVEKLDTTKSMPEDLYNSIEQTKPSNSVWLITATVAMGGFLFGWSYSMKYTRRMLTYSSSQVTILE